MAVRTQKRNEVCNGTRLLRCCLIAVLLCTSGCLFEPREAESPDAASTWIVPDFPQKVFSNMESGLEELSGGNYERSLGAEFTFVPLPGDLQQQPDAYVDWTRAVEIDVTRKLLGEASKIEVDFTGLKQVISQSDFAQFEANYKLVVTDVADPQDVTNYRGKGRFDMKLGGRGWELVKWEDIEAAPLDPTWGYLRGTLREK